MRANDTLGGTLQIVNNEMSKGAQTIAPVDNSKDELYAILRRRLFKHIDLTAKDIEAVADEYVAELKKASAIIDRPTMKVREEILVSYPFHFSTKHLIGSFNDNPGFQKTGDVIRLMAAIVRSLWDKDNGGEAAVAKHYLLSLETADLNDSLVASRFVEIKTSLQDAMQTDIANSGTSHAESLDGDTDGLAACCARWLFAASLSEVHPRGLTEAELAEYLLAPGRSIQGLHEALKQLYDTCWYIEQTQSGRYRFNRHKNLNAQVNRLRQHLRHRRPVCTDRGHLADCTDFQNPTELTGDFANEARFLLALKLFELGRITSGKAGRLCGMGRVEFLLAASRAGVPVVDLTDDELVNEFA